MGRKSGAPREFRAPPEKRPIISTQTLPALTGFQSFRLGTNIQRGIAEAGYEEPRPIQAATIPSVLEGRDVLGLAQTGTGKTAAFALPILELLLSQRRPGPRALILAPTRELAMQIHSDIETLGRFTRVRATTVFGGVSMSRQIRVLRSQPDIVVACPGRLIDLYQQGVMKLDGIDIVVIDEADNMFDMGFLPDIRRILNAIPRQRQTLLFSATMPKEIRQLANGILHEPKVVELNHTQPLSTIEHELYPVGQKQKLDLLEQLVNDEGFTSAIVFMRTKHRALRVAQQLSRDGHNAVALQGNMTQAQRDRAMRGFREGRFNILVATDIAARGIDVAHVSHVINFDMPDTTDAYTHRIGRTGRAERSGKAYTFITNEDAAAVRTLERTLGTTIQRCQLEGFGDTEAPAPQPQKFRSPKPRTSAPQRSRSSKNHSPERRSAEQGTPERRFTGHRARTSSAAPARSESRPPARTRRFSGSPGRGSRTRRW